MTKLEELAEAYRKAWQWAEKCRAARQTAFRPRQIDDRYGKARFAEVSHLRWEADRKEDAAHRALINHVQSDEVKKEGNMG